MPPTPASTNRLSSVRRTNSKGDKRTTPTAPPPSSSPPNFSTLDCDGAKVETSDLQPSLAASDVGHPTAASGIRLSAMAAGTSLSSPLQSIPLVDDGVRAKEEKEFARVKEQPPVVELLFVKREAYAALKNKISAQVRHDYRTPITPRRKWRVQRGYFSFVLPFERVIS